MSAIQEDDLGQAEKGVPVEEAAPAVEAAAPSDKSSSRSRRKIWVGIGLFVLLALAGLTAGLVVWSQKQKDERSSTGLTGSDNEGNEPTTTPPTDTSPPVGEPTGTTAPPTTVTATPSPVDVATNPPTTNTPTVPPTTPETPVEETLFYESSTGIFNVTLPLFSSSVALGYQDESELDHDLTEAVKFKINRAIDGWKYYAQRPVNDLVPETGADFAGDESAADSALPPASAPAGDVDDFETNTVEEGIDEGDLLKTNGIHAFAAYGQYVIAWDVMTGEQAANITLPSLTYNGQEPPKEPYEVLDPEEIVSNAAGGNGGRKKRRNLQFVADEYYYWPVEPTVQSLLLHEDKLVVIANGYGQFMRSTLDYMPVFYDAFSTNVRIYDISEVAAGELPLIKETHVHGTYNSIRAVENEVHLVTFSNIDTWTHLEQPLNRYQSSFQNLSDEEYYDAARQLAQDELIPNFVSRLKADLSTQGELANIARISMFQKHLSTDSKQEDLVFQNGVINAYAQITSFDMLDTSEELTMTETGVFMPTGWGHVYATNEMLVVAGQGWDWISSRRGSLQTTYLHGFALQNGLAVPAAAGSLDGSLLNEYSVDVVDNHMRVAVTIRNDGWVFAIEDTTEVDAEEPPLPRTENYIVVLEIPEVDETDTAGEPGILKEVGRSENLGEDGEVFRSVRFSDKIAYAVTFEQTDPFYVISFENATNPEVLGELKITGFSSYLHFVQDDENATLLLGVGQEADGDGRILGVQVTLYDATNRTSPSVIDRYSVELDKDVYSSSEAEWDFKAFRYVKLGDDFGILILPLRIDSYTSTEGNFDGFILLDISLGGISERFSIPHVDSADFRLGCYYWAQLAERSFVVGGNVTTLKGHSIRNYHLDSGDRLWGIDLDVDRVTQQDHCVFW